MRVLSKHSAPVMFFYLALSAGVTTASGSDFRRADIRGGGGDRGKCTIEVEVDDVADVEVRGQEARIRTLSGTPAFFRRFVCNQPMPRNPYEFRFRGIDGRGRQDLVRDPRSGGVAVVRIVDRNGGREGYTFDLEWRGGGGYPRGGSGYWDRGDWDRGREWDRDRDSNRDLRFRGRGDGIFRTWGGPNDRLDDCWVTVARGGTVEVAFTTSRNYKLALRGRVLRFERDRLFARISGSGVSGEMIIRLDGDRVREIRMDGGGRNGYELRWKD